jgi:hypothetical protein
LSEQVVVRPGPAPVIVVRAAGVVKVTQPTPPVIHVSPPPVVKVAPIAPKIIHVQALGLPGPPGSGIVDTVTYHQSIAASTWTVPHALGRRPQVEVTDDIGNDLWAHVDVLGSTPWTVSVVHTTPLTGWVYLS